MARARIIGGCLVLAVMLGAPGADAREFTGHNDLGVEPDLMRRVQEGLEMVYQRQYPEALDHFATVKELYPESPTGPFGTSVVYLAMMLENGDDDLRDEYRVAADQALILSEGALKSGQQKGWHTFLYAGIVGIDGLDRAQQGDVLGAINKGWDGIQAMKRAKRLEPGFADPDLGLGIYNYWRTLVAEDLEFLPSFGDHKAEGIAQMEHARDEGLLVWVGASLALAYAYKDAEEYDKAIAECLALQAEYPDSVINNTMLGYLYAKNRDYEESLQAYERVLALDPDNRQVVWHIGELYYRTGVHDDRAVEYLSQYLELQIPVRSRSRTLDRLGEIAQRQQQPELARQHFQSAVEADPTNKRARRHLEAMQGDR